MKTPARILIQSTVIVLSLTSTLSYTVPAQTRKPVGHYAVPPPHHPYHYPTPYPPRPVPRPVPVRPVPVPVRPVPVPVRPVPVVPLRPIPAPYPYFYHPFVPYYWGAYWHPIGFVAATIATTAIVVTIANQSYHYDEGVYYIEQSDGYKVVPAPVGAVVPSIPEGAKKITVEGQKYYYYGGTFYIKSKGNYKVVVAPAGAVVTHLPDGVIETTVNGQKYLLFNNTYYQPIQQNGQNAYVVIKME